MSNVHIYALCEPATGDVRYVGKATNSTSRLKAHLNDRGDTRRARWIRALRAQNLVPHLLVLESVTADNWQSAERRWIAHYRGQGVDLTNHTSGGEGLQNATEDTRAKLRRCRELEWSDPQRRTELLAIMRLPDRRAKISAALSGMRKTADHVAKLPQNRKGRTMSASQREAIRRSQIGRRHRPDTIEKLRELNRGNHHGAGNRSRKGQVQSAAERNKKSAALKGRAKTMEHREKIRQGALRRWARDRAKRPTE